MSRLRQLLFCLAAATVVFTASAQTASPVPAKKITPPANFIPPTPAPPSPVNYFRQLLVMPPAERLNSLTNRTPEARARVLAKVREYQALGPDERELRLAATELRWYLTPVLRAPPAGREALLAQMPPEMRELARTRLARWNLLPPSLQQEFLANDQTLHYFAHVEPTNHLAASPDSQKLAAQFAQIFELTPTEKKRSLGTLSAAERDQMEKTLQLFDQLPAQQRAQCIRNYARFAGMSAADRAEFLKNAESWSKLSPQERQTWRDLVRNVPLWPPMPPALLQNSSPPPLPKMSRASVATN